MISGRGNVQRTGMYTNYRSHLQKSPTKETILCINTYKYTYAEQNKCVYVFIHTHTHTHVYAYMHSPHIHIHTYMYIYMYVCVHVCIDIITKRIKNLNSQVNFRISIYVFMCVRSCVCYNERWGAGVETQKNVRGEIEGWGRVPFNEPYAPSLSTIYDGA